MPLNLSCCCFVIAAAIGCAPRPMDTASIERHFQRAILNSHSIDVISCGADTEPKIPPTKLTDRDARQSLSAAFTVKDSCLLEETIGGEPFVIKLSLRDGSGSVIDEIALLGPESAIVAIDRKIVILTLRDEQLLHYIFTRTTSQKP